MHLSKETQQGWIFAAQTAGTIGTAKLGADYLASVEEAIRQLEDALNTNPHRNLSVGQFQGFVFEDYSAETFNIDAAAAGSKDHAHVLDSHDLGSVDVKLDSGKEYSLKSYATAEKSTTEQARLNLETRQPLYKNQYRVVPTDKLEEAREVAARRAVRAQNNRPDVAESYSETHEKLTDIIENDEGVKSKPVSRKELNQIADEAKKGEFKAEDHDITPETAIKTKYLLEQAGKAGLTAAAITMAIQLAPEIIKTIDYLVRVGEIKPDQLLTTGKKAITAGGESFLRGSVAFTLTLAIKEGKLGVIKDLNPTLTGMLVAVTIQVIKDSIMVAIGKMKLQELEASLVRTTVIAGGTIFGMAAITKICASIGQTICPVAGLIIGTLVGCTVSVLYNLGKKQLISFCVDSGFTCFGLVEQDYSLPEEVLHELGIDTIPIPKTEVPRTQIETVSYTIDPDRVQFDRVEYTVLKRGIIGVNRIGYIPVKT